VSGGIELEAHHTKSPRPPGSIGASATKGIKEDLPNASSIASAAIAIWSIGKTRRSWTLGKIIPQPLFSFFAGTCTAYGNAPQTCHFMLINFLPESREGNLINFRLLSRIEACKIKPASNKRRVTLPFNQKGQAVTRFRLFLLAF